MGKPPLLSGPPDKLSNFLSKYHGAATLQFPRTLGMDSLWSRLATLP